MTTIKEAMKEVQKHLQEEKEKIQPKEEQNEN